ncbi:MAG: (Fe-S)-binding protein [Anaerolineales bacterium]|nr:(Fe-S)-binding protein [Anaerolineales bacterium]
MEKAIEHVIRANQAYLCLDCGKCTSVCPISWRETDFSPRLLVEAFRIDGSARVLEDDRLWACLTCGRCSQVCPSDVHFGIFIREMRHLARDIHQEGHCSHSETLQTLMRMMANPTLQQNRLDWIAGDLNAPEHLRGLHTSESGQSDTIYFTGCLPYFQSIFSRSGAQCVEIAQSAVKTLNLLGIEPVVLADERCCGHDLLWEGEVDAFEQLKALNTELIRSTGARRIITTCPECARTLKMDYNLQMEVMHISEFLAGQNIQIAGREAEKVTYQDPCRLGRHMGKYDQPRQVIDALGFELVEMEHNRARALCCGTSAWTHCGATAKQIQLDRLQEASSTGAKVLVTSCVKCQIHFKCAQDDPRIDERLKIEIKDLITLAAEEMSR